MKRTIRLTEQDLNKMIYAATKQYINELQEITTKQAAMAAGANTAASLDYNVNGTADAESKINRSDLVRLPLITKSLIDKFGNFKIKLVEQNKDNKMWYVNYFIFDCIVLVDDNSCVTKGELSIGGRPYSIGYIKIDFAEDKFYRVRCGQSLRVSIIAQIEPFKGDSSNVSLTNNIIATLKEILSQENTNRQNAINSTITPSKPRKPLTPQSIYRLYGDYLSAYGKKKAITPIEKI